MYLFFISYGFMYLEVRYDFVVSTFTIQHFWCVLKVFDLCFILETSMF